MSSGSEIFETYKKEYLAVHESISEKLNDALPNCTPEQRKLLCNQTNRELEEADEIIGQMEMELQSLPQSIRIQLNPIVKSYKNDIKKLKKDLTKFSSNASSERDQLLARSGSHVVDFEIAGQDQRSRLNQGTQRLEDGSRRLEDARRLAHETEAVGVDILVNLQGQREQLLRTRETLNSADNWIGKSAGVLRGMQKRMAQNKLITTGIICLMVIMILLIVFLKWG